MILRVVMVVLMLFLAFAYYRVSIDPQGTVMSRALYRVLANRYVRGPQMGATTQARLLAVMFVCLAVLFIFLAFRDVPAKPFGP